MELLSARGTVANCPVLLVSTGPHIFALWTLGSGDSLGLRGSGASTHQVPVASSLYS